MRKTISPHSKLLNTPFSTWIWFSLTLLVICIFTIFGPAEHSLGTHIRIVYLHGAWVWAAIAAFFCASLCGLLAFFTRYKHLHCWSSAFGKTGIFFWITYLPLSLWAMQSNWNGLFLAEPRWRLAFVFTIAGLMLQVGLSMLNNPGLTSSFNIAYFIALMLALKNTPNVMHPGSPILNSEALRIQLFFFGLVALVLLAAWQVARWWYKSEPDCLGR